MRRTPSAQPHLFSSCITTDNQPHQRNGTCSRTDDPPPSALQALRPPDHRRALSPHPPTPCERGRAHIYHGAAISAEAERGLHRLSLLIRLGGEVPPSAPRSPSWMVSSRRGRCGSASSIISWRALSPVALSSSPIARGRGRRVRWRWQMSCSAALARGWRVRRGCRGREAASSTSCLGA